MGAQNVRAWPHLGVLRGHIGVGAVVGRVAVPLERNRPLPGLGAALDLLHLCPEVDVLTEVELFREPVSIRQRGNSWAAGGEARQGKARQTFRVSERAVWRETDIMPEGWWGSGYSCGGGVKTLKHINYKPERDRCATGGGGAEHRFNPWVSSTNHKLLFFARARSRRVNKK